VRGGHAGQVDQAGGLGQPGPVPDGAVGLDRRVPNSPALFGAQFCGLRQGRDCVPHRCGDREPEGEPDSGVPARCGETVGGTGGIGP